MQEAVWPFSHQFVCLSNQQMIGQMHTYLTSRLSSIRLAIIVNMSAYHFIRKCASSVEWHRTVTQWTHRHLVVLATQVTCTGTIIVIYWVLSITDTLLWKYLEKSYTFTCKTKKLWHILNQFQKMAHESRDKQTQSTNTCPIPQSSTTSITHVTLATSQISEPQNSHNTV